MIFWFLSEAGNSRGTRERDCLEFDFSEIFLSFFRFFFFFYYLREREREKRGSWFNIAYFILKFEKNYCRNEMKS